MLPCPFLSLPFHAAPGALSDTFAQMITRLDELGFPDALWSRRLDVWTSDPATQEKIRNRLGWLSAVDAVAPRLSGLRALADALRREGHSDIVLLGMGGSSLAPEVLRQVLGVRPGYPRFRMLDSVDPEAVRDAMAGAETSVFVLASKSGSTIEPNAMAAEARCRLLEAGVTPWGSRFIAITDQNTDLHRRAEREQFREIFVNPSDIGGRYSALSLFGMVPAALMGADVEALIASARDMEAACRRPRAAGNPALALGAFMAAGVRAGRDKLVLLLPPPLASFGLWVEQLVAESTGKAGTGIVPIAGETTRTIGPDCVVVAVSLAGESPQPELVDLIRRGSTTPLFEFNVPNAVSIAAEFLRWEIATAAAGVLMGINPFDEPNVQQAKDATRVLLDEYRAAGRLPVRQPHATIHGAWLTLSAAAEAALEGREPAQFLQLLEAGDYLALLAFLPPDREPFDSVLGEIRTSAGSASGCRTMFGYGPRYLHSTGQLHKGGANNGVFIIVTAELDADLPIDGEPFSFGVLEMAQALGDFASLDREARRALHVHLPNRNVKALEKVFGELI